MLADTGNDEACSLSLYLVHHDVGHYSGVFIVKMRDGFICKQEVEGLHKGTNHSYSLLLAEAHQADRRLFLISNPECLEPLQNLLFCLMMRQAVLYLDVLHCRQFGEEPQLLKEEADVPLTQLNPVLHLELATVLAVKENLAREVLPIADDKAAERTLACAALSLYEVSLALFKGDILPPYFALDVSPLQKDIRQSVVESDVIHRILFIILLSHNEFQEV